MNRRWLRPLAPMTAAVAAIWALGRAGGGRPFVRMAAAGPAPVWTGANLAGQPLSSEALRGRVVLLNFWATWCAPCLRELPDLDAFQARHAAEGLVVVGASAGDDDEDALRGFARRVGVGYPLLRASPAMMESFGRNASDPVAGGFPLPNTWVIRRDGTLSAHYLGALPPSELERAWADATGSAAAPVPGR